MPELALVSSIKQHPPSLNASKCTREELQENLKDQGKNKWENNSANTIKEISPANYRVSNSAPGATAGVAQN